MVGSSYDQKPYRRSMMQTWGGERSPLAEHADTVRARRQKTHGVARDSDLRGRGDRRGARGHQLRARSVLNHVLLHQTVIGQEAIAQMEMAGEQPDVVIGCVGGGSNFGGLTFPFVRQVLGRADVRFIAAEPSACPTLTRGVYRYDYGDTAGFTPLMPMFTLGHDFVPAPVHAGGLRYHGDAPMVCALVHSGMVEARAYRQNETFAAAVQFARTEGIIPAPEPAHAIRAVIQEAEAAREAGEKRVILFGLCGHGNFDLVAYDAYLGRRARGPRSSQSRTWTTPWPACRRPPRSPELRRSARAHARSRASRTPATRRAASRPARRSGHKPHVRRKLHRQEPVGLDPPGWRRNARR